MKRGSLLVIITLLSLILSGPLTAVFAADDSNSGNLSPNPTLNPQQLASTLSTLGQGVNDSNVQKLLNQFNSQVKSGNTTGADSALLQLKSDAQNNPKVSASLKALLQSVSVGQNGFTVDPALLSALLGENSNTGNGVPTNLKNESPAQLSLDLNTLANLLQYVDPNLASALLGAGGGVSQGSGGPGLSIAPPGINPNTLSLPAVIPPLVGSVGGSSLPALNPAEIIFPVVVIIAIVAIFFSRSRLGRMLGSQRLPGEDEMGMQEPDFESNPGSPRGRIVGVFRRTVRIMKERGVAKLKHETHREFSSKCSDRPEGQRVGTIASLYEKALFSGKEVTESEATLAENEAESLEKPS